MTSLWSVFVMNRSVANNFVGDCHSMGVGGHPIHHQEKNSNGNASSSIYSSISIGDWDEWDETLWTAKQRQWLEQGVVPREVYVTLSVVLSLVVVFGLIANATILYIFSRFKRLRTPANVLVINLTACDFISCLIHPMAVYSSYRGRWSFGKTGCNLYATGIGFFGLNSIVTLSAIACERYIVITSSSCRPAVARWRITRCQAQKACVAIWLHCAALVAPPWLLGWSSYEPEGVLVTCSWDYTTRTLSNRLYYLYLLFFGFVLPVSVLTFCYVAIFRFIVRSSREMTRMIMTSHVKSPFSTAITSFRKRRRQTDVRTAMILLSLAMLCYTAWTPYAIVSLIGQFGPVDEDGRFELSPMATSIPAFLAKTAIVFDPLLYGFSHPQFRSSVRQILQHNSFVESSNNGLVQRGVVNNKGHPHGATTLMMVTAGLRHTGTRQQFRSQSLHTSSAAVSWAKSVRNASELDSDIHQSMNEIDHVICPSFNANIPPISQSTETMHRVCSHPKRAMSLATVMWNKNHLKKTAGSSKTLTRGSSCRENVYRCWTSVMRPDGDAVYLLNDGKQWTDKCRQPWIVTDGRRAFYPPSAMIVDEKNKGQQSSRTEGTRRLSESDLLQRMASREKGNRRKNKPMALRSIGDLTAQLIENDPLFVVVALPARPAMIDDCQLSNKKVKKCIGSPLHFPKFSRSASPCLSSARSVTNVGFLPRNTFVSRSIERHRQQSMIFDGRVKLASGGCRSNSISCPLISP
ncbi:arthropsin3 [Daphnia sinensis]|uniref:Arthropsin3 n=1 Tax=Daphnia sinensis TaxID=1820382 RepID=A0AAD5L048_9CRUS|nr:arthropsin3 [Daphnia sinensis]